MRRLLVVLATAPALAMAQAPKRTAKCAPIDAAADWHKSQRAWFDDSKGGWSDDAFRSALLSAAGIDAKVPVQLGFEVAGENVRPAGNDADVIARLRTLAGQRGSTWPTRSVVGAAGTYAVWLLAARDSLLAPGILKHMMEAGPDESPPALVAQLEDRLRLRNGRKQLYGTQMQRNADGTVSPLPTEDLAHVDLRRDGATLPPIAVSSCAATRK